MALKMLLMVLAISMLLTSGTERSKEVSTRGHRLCLCSDRVLRLPSSQDSEASYSASYSASCKEMCAFNSNAGVLLNDSRRHLRSRRDVLEEAKNCRFNKVRPDWPKLIIEVAFHRSSENSSEWFAEVFWSPFNGTSHLWIGYYTLYSTGRWQVDKNVNCQVMPKNQTSMNISSTADEETISINVAPLPKSLNLTGEYKDMSLTAYSSDKPNYLGVPSEYGMQPSGEGEITVVTYVSITVGILAGIVLGAGLLKYCLCRKKRNYFPPEFTYHAFIVYQKDDSYWVIKQLLPFLEEEHHIKCCIHYRDFTPGMPFVDNMAECVFKSYKIIAVFSSNFLKSSYANHELNLAQYRLLNRRDDSLIIIRIDKTDPSSLPPVLQKRSFIDYSDLVERPFWKGKLLKFLNSGSQSVSTETDNNNRALQGSNEQNAPRQARAEFDRLNSTTSTSTEISIVSYEPERLI